MSLPPALAQRSLPWLLAVLAGGLLLLGMAVGQRLPRSEAGMELPAAAAEGPAADDSPARVPGTASLDRAPGNQMAGLPLDLAAALEGRGNLYDYARLLQPAAAAGDAQASWTLSRIHDYCGHYAQNPQGYALDAQWLAADGDAQLRRLAAARQGLGQRCSGFAAGALPAREQVVQQRVQAARGGNLAAEAALLAMGQPLADDDSYRRQLVERVILSQDAEAFLALSPAMGAVAAGDPALADTVSGTQFTQLAWQVAACRLGMACGPDSLLMSSYCANAGICSRRPEQDFESFVFDAAVPPQGVEKMNELIQQLRRPRGTRS